MADGSLESPCRVLVKCNWTSFLSRTVEALQGKLCQNSLPSGGACHLEPRFQGEGVVPGEFFLVSTKLDTFCYPTVQTAQCYVPSFWHNTSVWQTDGQTDGIAIASTVLEMRSLRRAVKMDRGLYGRNLHADHAACIVMTISIVSGDHHEKSNSLSSTADLITVV